MGENTEVLTIDPAFRDDVLRGFAARPRAIAARWLYDRRGSELFEEITRLPEYYPTRIETHILISACQDLRKRIGVGRAVIEFGSGSSTKTRTLLRCIEPAAYVPIDISGAFLRAAADALADDFGSLPICPLEADFMHRVTLPPMVAGMERLGFFPGSTIGNLVAERAVDLLRDMRATLGDGALLLVGMDRLKAPEILLPAYDDPQGVTAQFNLNLLTRINRELGGNIPVAAFRHRARWNNDAARIEMHLEACHDVQFSVAGEEFSLRATETIHTENSHKYTPRAARLLLRAGGWTPLHEWTDAHNQFALILAAAKPETPAP